ncbi:hypothetical protein N7456_010631 [Penicillium angulare]|uniref:Uncharacterized protein n=1 Tax=Penicillium angulare TaxID=116970 RepID=A0A9W9K6P5_9EURO|nr:hypothetical protein N7456_010631 [Penicillium angulare]
MIALYSKTLPIAVLSLLLPSALACVQFRGYILTGTHESMEGTISTDEGSLRTCESGSMESGDNDVDCIDGYSLNYDVYDNLDDLPDSFPVTYCNPNACYDIDVQVDCDTSGLNVPTVFDCTFDYTDPC